MRQRLAQELLDEDGGTPEEIARSLDELGWIHRHLGGLSSWRQLLQSLPAAESVLDVGAGRGEVAAYVGASLGARRIVALDRRTSHMGASGSRVAGDALRLPFADRSFEVVMCNLFLHHFHGAAAGQVLGEMARVARRAVVINDLERHWAAYAAIWLLRPRFSRITRYDGPRSVRQAYTAEEMEQLAGARRHTLVRLTHYRLGLILYAEAARGD
ncbi:MAG: methyltransferase domain-containing protein [Terriglobales bacterium]